MPPQAGTVIEGLEMAVTAFPDIRLFRSKPSRDRRGSVQATYNADYFAGLGVLPRLVHENHCVSPRPGTMRGFHYQLPPYGQPKLIRVVRGRILDVNVDLRRSSPTFGRHVAAELDWQGWSQIYVPEGFAHCYVTLEADTEVIFKLGCGFAPTHARGLAYDDPDLAVAWPFAARDVVVLPRDLDRPRFSELTEDELFP